MDRALWFVAPRQVELRPVDIPPLEHGEVLVRTSCSGVSAGTELLAYRGELPGDLAVDESIGALGGSFTYPFRYGYSCVGGVEALGPGVENLTVGDRVFAFQPHQERFVAAASELVAVPTLEPRMAVMLPYVETALQIVLDAGPLLGDAVVVSGLGALGLLVATLAARAGAGVVGIEPQPWRREMAAELGISAVDPADASDPAAGALNVPLVIECSGNPAALANALDLLAHEGTVLVASWYGSKPVSLPLGGPFHRRRLTIRSTQVSTIPAALSGRWSRRRRLMHAVDLAPTLPLAQLATDTVPFEQAGEGYARLDAGAPGVVHIAFGYR
jgi:2-desacetyl-2-hydroxyethyl bacteriochlorophyllide A dehydrogenase